MNKKFALLTILACICFPAFHAPAQEAPPLGPVISGLVERMKTELGLDGLKKLTPSRVESFLTDSERTALSTGYCSFDVNAPATVWLACTETPFWAESAGFVKTADKAEALGTAFSLLRKDVEPGRVSLGINGFRGGDRHYFVIVAPRENAASFEVSGVSPERCRAANCRPGALVYANDLRSKLEEIPAALEGATLIRGARDRGDQTKIIGAFRFSPAPSGPAPDDVVLTWSADPMTTQTIQWRTNPDLDAGAVEFRPASDTAATVSSVAADMTIISDAGVLNDPVNHHFTAALSGLTPGEAYAYRAGDPAAGAWTDWETFTTAPAGPESFSFVYLGDAQVDFAFWTTLLHTASAVTPTPRFYAMAGDLVNRGNERDDWDDMLAATKGVYDRFSLMPTVGNHEYKGTDGPATWMAMFDLPKNGPDNLPKERIYSYHYAGAFFVVLDPNLEPEEQSAWLDEQLAGASGSEWKFALFHQPVYSFSKGRDNQDIREAWAPLFEKYGVDMVLEGHDHGYLRTYPMKENKKSTVADGGVYYVVANSGGKHYEPGEHDYAEVTFAKVSTYQVISIDEDKDALTYRAYDVTGALRDEVTIDKSGGAEK